MGSQTWKQKGQVPSFSQYDFPPQTDISSPKPRLVQTPDLAKTDWIVTPISPNFGPTIAVLQSVLDDFKKYRKVD